LNPKSKINMSPQFSFLYLTCMSHTFRDLLKKIGSGPHTGKDLTRQEAATATKMLLLQEATPAQIGAFMIAQRIKRPTGEELAGMLDAYDELGPKLQPATFAHPVMVFGSPYDGRDRTAPLSIGTALILIAASYPVILHGGERMPTKEGVPLIDIWRGLGVDWATLSLEQVQQVFAETGLGFVYLPTHFPLAHGLVTYRDQIGKRPPLATVELIWSPYAGDAHIVAGFVHPPTEDMVKVAFALRQTYAFTTVKGLEGSCDLPRERTAIIGLGQGKKSLPLEGEPAPDAALVFDRLHLHPRDYGFAGANAPLLPTPDLVTALLGVLQGEPSELATSIIWNSSFYLWRCGACADILEAIATAKTLLSSGSALQALKRVQKAIAIKPTHFVAQV
jgi:anthranilate phosphoribosyltransferase